MGYKECMFLSFNFIYTNTSVCKVYNWDYCMLDYQKEENLVSAPLRKELAPLFH